MKYHRKGQKNKTNGKAYRLIRARIHCPVCEVFTLPCDRLLCLTCEQTVGCEKCVLPECAVCAQKRAAGTLTVDKALGLGV